MNGATTLARAISDRPGKTSHVAEELERLAATITELDMLANRMHDRLSPILRSEDPMKDGPADPEPRLVDVAEAIRTQRNRLGLLCSAVSRMLDRVEI